MSAPTRRCTHPLVPGSVLCGWGLLCETHGVVPAMMLGLFHGDALAVPMERERRATRVQRAREGATR